jgi:hypothetical protein
MSPSDIAAAVREALAAVLSKSGPLMYDECLKAAKDASDELAQQGLIRLGEDRNLGGWALEVRVKLLLTELGFDVQAGRPGLEDFIVPPPGGFTPDRPLVLEVKSGKASGPDREALRQLDDWVFDLSGEAEIRHGIVRYEFYGHGGSVMASPRATHPTPHKGVLIYNGPLGVPFHSRLPTWFEPDKEAFAQARNFCVVSLGRLLEWHGRVLVDASIKPVFWQEIHRTAGVLGPPL